MATLNNTAEQSAVEQSDAETAEKLRAMELMQRPEASAAGRCIYWLGIAFAVMHIYFNTIGTLPELWVASIHFAGFALLCALMVPVMHGKSVAGRRFYLLLDCLLGLAAILCAAYLIGFEDALYDRG